LVNDGDMAAAKRLYGTMKADGYGHSVLAQTILMKGYLDQGFKAESKAVFDNMIRSGIVPNFMTYAVLMKAYSSRRHGGDSSMGRKLLDQVLKSTGLIETSDDAVIKDF